MTTNRTLRILFVLSVWLLISLSVWQLFHFLEDADNYRSVPTAFQGRVLMGPLVIGGMEVLFWFRFFAHEREGTCMFAAMMGLFMLVLVLVLVSLLTGRPESSIAHRHLWPWLFIGIVHIAYAVGARERGW